MILIVNLMPDKVETENNFRDIFKDIPLDFLKMATHSYKGSSSEELSHYLTLDKIKDKNYLGAVITGAPLEYIDFSDVDYWDELKEVMEYLDKKVKSTLYICWGAQAGLYHFYGFNKFILQQKIFGVYNHKVLKQNPFVDEDFMAPHSRNSFNRLSEIVSVPDLDILAASSSAGPYLIADKNYKKIFITGHGEYPKERLKKEYLRDISSGKDIEKPDNYFDAQGNINFSWENHRKTFYENWIRHIGG